MKIIIPIVLALLIFAANGLIIVGLFSRLSAHTASAAEYTPLDFMSGYEDFSVSVGVSKTNGRYASYHYEFTE